MEGGELVVSGIKAAVLLMFGPFLMVILLLASCGGGSGYQPCAFVGQPDPSATSTTPALTDAQWVLAERIIEANPAGPWEAFIHDPWLSAVAITAALYGSNLAPQPLNMPISLNPFTGNPTTESLDTIITTFYERAMSTSDWRSTPPTQLAAWVIGQPGGDLASYWPEASQITAHVTGFSADKLVHEQVIDPLCESAIGIDWNGTVTEINGWIFPAPMNDGITSGFGWRINPVTGILALHTGTDIGANCDAPIVAARDGVVLRRQDHVAGYGALIEIVHDSGERTRYAHMYPENIFVKEGDQVVAGQLIALVGTNGNSTGCHLHFELITTDGHFVNPARTLGWQ